MNPTPERRAAICAKLHQLADVMATTDLPMPDAISISVYGGSLPDQSGVNHSIDSLAFMALARLRLGACEKQVDESYFRLVKDFGDGVELKFVAIRATVCMPKVVGKRVIPAQPAKFVEAQPEREEDVIEWDCPSLLGAGASIVMDATNELGAPASLQLEPPDPSTEQAEHDQEIGGETTDYPF